MNPKNHNKVITELCRCEEELDKVLFEDPGYWGGAGGAAALGTTAGAGLYAYGRRGLKRKAAFDLQDIGSTVGRGGQMLAKDATKIGGDLWAKLMKMAGRAAAKTV